MFSKLSALDLQLQYVICRLHSNYQKKSLIHKVEKGIKTGNHQMTKKTVRKKKRSIKYPESN